MKAFYVALVIACAFATGCSDPHFTNVAQCETAKKEFAALRMCASDSFCQRTPNFYRDAVRAVGKMKENCPSGDVEAAAVIAE